jgi:HAMP domain-containing protein/HPt (histidine-containing phosphotransfer) domain-containing protein
MVEELLSLNLIQSAQSISNIHIASENTKRDIKDLFESNMRKKGMSLITKDAAALKTPFLENSIMFVRSFIVDAMKLDADIISASFITVEEGDIKAWQYVDQKYKKGLGVVIQYDQEQKSWVSFMNGRKIKIPAARIENVRSVKKPQVELIKQSFEDIDGSIRVIDAYEATIPVVEGDLAEVGQLLASGEPVGYLRYIISLESMARAVSQYEERIKTTMQSQAAETKLAAQKTIDIGRKSLWVSAGIVVVSALLVILAFYFVVSMLSDRLTRPLLQLAESAKKISNGNYDANIDVITNDEIGQLAESFDEMRVRIKQFTEHLQDLVEDRTYELNDALAKVTDETGKIRSILDHIEQGICTFSEDLKIDPQYSKFMNKLFDASDNDIRNGDFVQLLRNVSGMSDSQRQELRETLQMIFGGSVVGWEINSIHLPKQIEIQDQNRKKILVFEWYPMPDPEDNVQKVMVAIKDQTRERELENSIRESKGRSQRLVEVIAELVKNRRENTVSCLIDINNRCGKVQKILSDTQNYEDMFIELHTMKGACRTLDLGELALQTHQTESALKESHERGQPFTVNFENNFNNLRGLVNEYTSVAQEILKMQLEKDSSSFFTLANVIGSELLVLKGILGEAGIPLRQFSCLDQVNYWDHKQAGVLASIIRHGLINSVDHGYVRPSKAAPAADARIEVCALTEGANVIIEVRDWGVGFDLDKIKEIAKKRNFTPLRDEPRAWLAVLFESEVTTADSISATSGRGVGLDAVRRYVANIGGEVMLDFNEPHGAILRIIIPQKYVLAKDEITTNFAA